MPACLSACLPATAKVLNLGAGGAGEQAVVRHLLRSLVEDLGQHEKPRLALVMGIEEEADRSISFENGRSHLAHVLDGLLAHLEEELVLRIAGLVVVQQEAALLDHIEGIAFERPFEALALGSQPGDEAIEEQDRVEDDERRNDLILLIGQGIARRRSQADDDRHLEDGQLLHPLLAGEPKIQQDDGEHDQGAQADLGGKRLVEVMKEHVLKVHGPHGVGTPLARCAIPFAVSKSAPGVRNRKFACCHCDLLPTGATY
jgi:hypothetical protein